MGNFIEDFLFGQQDPQSGWRSGGAAAVADTLWPFEDTWVSTAVDSAAGQVITAPARAGAQAVLAGLTALDAIESYAIARPASTLLQAAATSRENINPLYRDGIQWQDFVNMWNASEYISPARAFAQYGIMQQAPVEYDANAPAEQRDLYAALSNPYPTIDGVSREEYERAWDNSMFGTLWSGTYDLGFLVVAGGKGVNAAASTAKKAAGLNTQVHELRQLTRLRESIESNREFVATSGASGQRTVPGQLIADLARETDPARIRSSPFLTNWTRSSSFNADELSHLISKTDNEELITELVLADRGDALALGRLFRTAPDHVWSLSHMNDKLAREFAVGGQFIPSEQTARVIKATFDTAVERDEFFRTARDLFMSGRMDDPLEIGEDAGLLNAVRGAGSDFLPIGSEGVGAVANVTGNAQRWLRRIVADARINRPNTYVEVPLGARNSGPLTTLLFWAGNRQPLNMVSYNRLRPDEVVEEMLAYSRSARTLRRSRWTVTRLDPDTGLASNIDMPSWQWRSEAIARITAAKAQGDVALDGVIRDLQEELISVAINRYNVPPEQAAGIMRGLQDQVDAAQAQVARDGFFMDGAEQVVLDPVTMRQLPDSRILMPLDDLDWALRINSETRYARTGRGTRRVLRGGAATADVIFKWFRTNILFRPGYTPKNSFAEPGLSGFLADGSIFPRDGLFNAMKRFDRNNDRRLLQFKYAVADKLPMSPARRDAAEAQRLFASYAEKSRRLDELEQHIADLDSAGTSPATRAKYLAVAQEERKIVYRQVKDLERNLDLLDEGWTQVDEVPTYSELSDRVGGLRSALTDPDFVTTATRRIDTLRDLAVTRQSGARNMAATLEEIRRLRSKREELVMRRDGLFKREGRRAAERDLKNPAKNKRRDLVDPENPEARVAPDWIEQLARVNDPRPKESLSRIPGRGADERRIEAVVRSISYLDEQIADLEATARVLSKSRVPSSGLTPVEQAELDQLSALVFARSKVDLGEIDAQVVLDDLSSKLDEIRDMTFTLEPGALKQMERLRKELAALDGERASLASRIAARQLSRERLAQRDFSGETDYTLDVGGIEYTIPAPFKTTGNYGSALRAETSADLTAMQTMTGGKLNGASAGMRWRQSELGEAISPFDPRYWDELTHVVNRHITGDEFANLLLSGKSDAEILRWFNTPNGKEYMRRMGWTYEELRGGPKGSVPATPQGTSRSTDARITLLEDGIIARNRRLLAQYFPDPDLRRQLSEFREWTPGELQAALGQIEGLSPIYGTGLEFIGNPLARVNRAVNNGLNVVWRNLAVKPESRFARWPFYTREYQRQMRREIRLAQDRGQVVDGAALQAMRSRADARAIKEMENTFYNVRRMTNPVFALRYITAFAAAAWNTAYRYMRLAYRNPGRATILANTWMNALEAFGTDEQGNEVTSWKDAEYLIFSLPDEWDVPIDPSLKINTSSINLGTQESGFLPTLTVGVSMLMREKPEVERAIREGYPEVWEAMFGFGTNTDPKYDLLGIPLDPFMGSYQKRAVLLARNVEEVAGIDNPFFQEIPDEDWARIVSQDLDYQLFEWARNGQQGPIPTVDESIKNAKDYLVLATLASWASPAALGLTPEGRFYRDEWYRIRSSFPNNLPAAIAQARLEYGPEFFFMMQSTSTNRAGMPPTQDAYDIWRDNQDALATLRDISPNNPNMVTSLLFLDEQTYNEADFSEVVYNWQDTAYLPGDSEPIRDRPSPQERMDEYTVSRSWALWNQAVAKRDALMLQYGFKSLQPDNESSWLYDQWEAFEAQFRADRDNALWVADKDEFDTGRADRAIAGIDFLLQDRKFMNSIGKSVTWQAIRDYRVQLFNAREAYEAAETSEDSQAIAEQWDQFVREQILPQAGNFAGYYERFLAGRDLSGQQLLDRPLNIAGFPLPSTSGVPINE